MFLMKTFFPLKTWSIAFLWKSSMREIPYNTIKLLAELLNFARKLL